MGERAAVLLLTSDLDFATDRVCRRLAECQVPFLRINREQLPELRLTLDPSNLNLECRQGDHVWFVDNTLRSVWWRQGTFDRNVASRPLSIYDQMARTQWAAFMRSMMVFRAHWMNHPAAVYKAEVKAVQLLAAREAGFSIPETLMTNDAEAIATAFGEARIAIKSVDTLFLREGDEQLFAYTTIVEPAEIDGSQLSAAPMTAQAALEPKLDIRVTIVGANCWANEVRANGEAVRGDWRLTPKIALTYPDHELPAKILECCFALVRGLSLSFGAIDLALVDNVYWFIEINPTGEWGWLDTDKRCISRVIAQELACLTPD